MRKNLFLTLALALASFAGALAQDWAVTLGSAEGLPGETVFKDGGNIKYYKSGIIKANKPIKSLRLTCAGNSTSYKPNGNNYRLMLSELNIYSADNLKEELNYTVTTNADHVTLAKQFDGQGLRALYDGKYNNYFASMSAEANAVADFHYVELTFEDEIERFIIEWGGKQGSGEAPSVVGLTEGGVAFVEPYTDRSSSFSEEKITSFDALKAAKYFTICGNAPTSYDTYNNSTGEKTSKEPVAGSGPMYVTLGDTYAEEPTIDYMTRLIEAGDDTYYVYFTNQKKYLSADGVQNALNGAQNGWQYATTDITKAAKVNFIALANGDFEMTYHCEKGIEGGEEFNFNDIVYIGADPRTGKMKIFSKVKKQALEAQGWCEGFGLVCAFNWSFYPAEYNAPVWAKEYEIGTEYIAINELQDFVNNATLADVIESLEETMHNSDKLSEDEIAAAVANAQAEVADVIAEVASEEYDEMENQWDTWKRNSKSSFAANYYPLNSYNELILPGATLIEEITELSNPYDRIVDLTNYFRNKNANIKAFEASKYDAKPMPFEYAAAADAVALGTEVGGAYVWEQSIGLNKKVNGIRITFLETNVGNAAGGGKYNGYPMVALGELEIRNEEGDKINLTADLITTNSQETSEGPMTNLVDSDNATFWHSIWGNGSMNPVGEVYLDIKFPEGTELNVFDLKIVGRNNKSLSPKRIVFSEYNKAHNEVEEVVVANPYNVKIGTQITDLAQLKDGGLYVLQGNLFVNVEEEPSEPRFYAGIEPSANKADKLDETNVYMFKKAGDCWNILSLSNGKYWTSESGMLTVFASKAEDLKFAKSNNMENTWAIYSEIDTVLSSNYTHVVDETTSIKFDSVGVKTTARVFMDWDSGLASRPCYSPLPGVADPVFTQLTEDLKVKSSCGDYLHYNKTNGEGEWCIYEATMNDEYFVYLTGLVNEVENLKFTPGEHPGCIKADSATSAEYKNAKAAAKVAVNKDRKNNAEAVATRLIEAIDALANSERVGFDAEAVYRIESGLPKYKDNTWYTRSLYADTEAGLFKWTVTPDNFEGENAKFLFNIIPVDEVINADYFLNVAEEDFGKVFIIKLANQEKFAGVWSDGGDSRGYAVASMPVIYQINNLEARNFEIKEKANGTFMHTEGHGEGNGYEGLVVSWNCNPNLYSASSWKFINNALPDYEEVDEEDIEDDEASIEDLVVEGDEVVSVCYVSPAGTAIPAPVKGLNIVVTVYANGVIEAKKKLVK